MVALLATSLGFTAICLLIIRLNVQQQIREGLVSDLQHSLVTFQNIERQRNEMLSREAALLGDLPSLKALMATQDVRTIQDGSLEFWKVSGSDFFALANPEGDLLTHSNRGEQLPKTIVEQGVQDCLRDPTDTHVIALGNNLYEVSAQPLYFGPVANKSQLGFVIIGYAVDQRVAREVSEAAAAEVAFLNNGREAATTLAPDRIPALLAHSAELHTAHGTAQWLHLGQEEYMAASVPLSAAGQATVQLVVLKSYDQASVFLKRVNQWIVALGLATLVIGGLLAAAISRTVTRPLEALVAGTRALGRGDFESRFSADGAEEVRELGRAFDRMRGELRRTQQELLESERLATIGRMASSVSHDLRHHLSAVYANAEFMSLDKTRQEERHELLFEIRDAIQGMTDLIESLLLFSQTGQLLNPCHESIGLLMERTVHSIQAHPEARDVEIIFEPHQPVEACVDGKKLGRAIYNLVLNACQAARRAGRPARVTLALTEDANTVRIDIRDSGAGVPDAIRQTLFQPFVSAGKENGTGLGLTLAQHIAQEHGGKVVLGESAPGRTVFTVLLFKAALEAFNAANKQKETSGKGQGNARLVLDHERKQVS